MSKRDRDVPVTNTQNGVITEVTVEEASQDETLKPRKNRFFRVSRAVWSGTKRAAKAVGHGVANAAKAVGRSLLGFSVFVGHVLQGMAMVVAMTLMWTWVTLNEVLCIVSSPFTWLIGNTINFVFRLGESAINWIFRKEFRFMHEVLPAFGLDHAEAMTMTASYPYVVLPSWLLSVFTGREYYVNLMDHFRSRALFLAEAHAWLLYRDMMNWPQSYVVGDIDEEPETTVSDQRIADFFAEQQINDETVVATVPQEGLDLPDIADYRTATGADDEASFLLGRTWARQAWTEHPSILNNEQLRNQHRALLHQRLKGYNADYKWVVARAGYNAEMRDIADAIEKAVSATRKS